MPPRTGPGTRREERRRAARIHEVRLAIACGGLARRSWRDQIFVGAGLVCSCRNRDQTRTLHGIHRR
jgi:hypothetical protein